MVEPMNAHDDDRSRLSALMDGQSTADDVAQLGGRWRQDAQLRATWHTYHLIGDVMRSDDLASPPDRDEAFLQALRARMAAEPVVLVPVQAQLQEQEPPRAARRRGWLAPAAAAAGFVAVAGVIIVLRAPQADGRLAPALAAASANGVQVAEGNAVVQPAVANGVLLRDPRLDRYLEAHRRLAAGTVAAMPMARPVEALAVESK